MLGLGEEIHLSSEHPTNIRSRCFPVFHCSSQVRRWREEKAEIAEMEERERAAQAAEEEANLKAEKQKEQEERQATKAKVSFICIL